MAIDLFAVLGISQFATGLVGVYFGVIIVYEYLIDYRYASYDEASQAHQLVAWSNIKRECLVLLAQIALLGVGISYHFYSQSDIALRPVFTYRQGTLLFVTTVLALKSSILLRDKRKLMQLLSK